MVSKIFYSKIIQLILIQHVIVYYIRMSATIEIIKNDGIVLGR